MMNNWMIYLGIIAALSASCSALTLMSDAAHDGAAPYHDHLARSRDEVAAQISFCLNNAKSDEPSLYCIRFLREIKGERP